MDRLIGPRNDADPGDTPLSTMEKEWRAGWGIIWSTYTA